MSAVISVDHPNREIVIRTPFEMKVDCENLSSRRWDKMTKTWRSPLTLATLEEVLFAFNGRAIVTDEVKSALENLRSKSSMFCQLKNRLDIDTDDATYDWKRDDTPPFRHQVSGTMSLLNRAKVILADEPGLGKTRTMIDAADERLGAGLCERVIIVCPATLKGNWKNEILRWSTYPCDPWQVLILDGDKMDRLVTLRAAWGAPWLILNYELARIHAEELVKLVDGQYLICDEAHRIKNMLAQTTKVIHSMRPQFTNLSTGTPVHDKPKDIFSLVQLVEPGLMGTTFFQFQDRYMIRGGFKEKEVVGYKNLDDMRARAELIMVRRLKDQVIDLPPKLYKRREIEMRGDQAREYKRMREELVAFYREIPEAQFRLRAANAMGQILRLQQIADGFLAVADLKPQWFEEQPKLDELKGIVEELVANNQKIVVWSRFLPVTEKVEQEFRQLGAVRIHGQVPAGVRTEMVRRFQEDPDCRVFVGQIQAGGEGITLTASTFQVFMDLPWGPSTMRQAEDRLHRMGTRGSVTVMKLICRNSIDERVEKLLKSKSSRIDVITGDDTKLTKRVFMDLLGEEEASE